MKTLVPNYYPDFCCKADRCRHTCCQKWEIDIDPATKRLYDSLPGPCGEELKKAIRVDENGLASFIFREDGYCPFLNENGLCRLILTYGEDVLCDICADHPRFRNFFSDRTEVGIGLCCEEAAHLILNYEKKAELVTYDADRRKRKNSEKENALLAFRDELFHIAQDRTRTLSERVEQIEQRIGLTVSFRPDIWVPRILSLERLDHVWDELMEAIGSEKAMPQILDCQPLQIPFEQFLVYHLFRYLPFENEQDDPKLNVSFCILMLKLFATLVEKHAVRPSISMSQIEDIARIYSSEIEYSDENVGLIIQMIQKDKGDSL